MKKKVTFDKSMEFPSMIGQISAISLDSALRFVDEANIEGDLIVSGKYKLTEASQLEEDFYYKIPIEITLTENLDIDHSSIEISDFTYETQENMLICHIELFIDGIEIIKENIVEEERECDGEEKMESEIEIPHKDIEEKIESEIEIPHKDIEEKIVKEEKKIENDVNILNKNEEKVEKDNSLFFNFKDDDDQYGTFIVYIVRQNETINSIIEKYHTTIEEIEQYNDIKDIQSGTKLIIPAHND